MKKAKDKNKEYVPPKCIDFPIYISAETQGCSTGSAPSAACSTGTNPSSDNPCWDGSTPSGFDGECSAGTSPARGF